MLGESVIYPILALVAGGIVGGLLGWLIARNRVASSQTELIVDAATAQSERDEARSQLIRLKDDLQSEHKEKERLGVQVARLEEKRTADQERLQWLDEAEMKLRETFEALAGKSLQANSELFSQRTTEQMESFLKRMQGDWQTQQVTLTNVVDPLKENLTKLDSHVRDLENRREGAYQGLQEQLRQLAEANRNLQNTTVTLSEALRSPTVRGKWGEVQLVRIVEMAGMVKHVDYESQVTMGDGSRPDMIALLPDGGTLPIDAKVPLTAYLDAMEATDEAARKDSLNKHAMALKNRVRELSSKRYWEKLEQTPGFVVMFIPNEACLGAAFEVDPDLLDFAFDRNVFVTTPVTLMALFKSVAFGWQQYQLNENARAIAKESQDLYKRFELFLGHLVSLRNSLLGAINNYNQAMGSLEHRLIPSVKRFEELGVAKADLKAPEPIVENLRLPFDYGEG